MIFSSITFMCMFLPLVVMTYCLLPGIKTKNMLLTIASLLFYAWGEPVYVWLMLGSVVINCLLGVLIERLYKYKRYILICAITYNIGLLVLFKYIDFLIDLMNQIFSTNFTYVEVALPIGISFFTFQALSYVVDVYRGEVKAQRNYFDLLLYISLFPQLIAGPIVKYHDIESQILKRDITVDKMVKGSKRFIYGLSKKVMIANVMALIVDTIFILPTSQLNAIATWIGALAYMFQIYFDFSGYSDMAIGLGQIFGFTFMENFNFPYTATSIKEFWNKWHISLSTWFKEYLYIPLGGNRKGEVRTYLNLTAVFLATGIWHGANLTFLVWGIGHGILMILERSDFSPVKFLKIKPLQWLYTILSVCLLFVIFRADTISYGLEYIKLMFTGWNLSDGNHIVALQLMNTTTVLTFVLAIILSSNKLSVITTIIDSKKYKSIVIDRLLGFCPYVLVILLLFMNLLELAANTYNPFIYFRF